MAGETINVTITEPSPEVIQVTLDNDAVDATSVAAAGALMRDANGAALEDLGAVEERASVVASTGATYSLDVSLYGAFDCTMDQNCAFSFTNPAPSGHTSSFTLLLKGAFTPTFPASVVWPGGNAPAYTTPALYVFSTFDAGTTWYGGQVGASFS